MVSFDRTECFLRGNAETPGEWSLAAFERDVEDLQVVARHLREELGYQIDLVV